MLLHNHARQEIVARIMLKNLVSVDIRGNSGAGELLLVLISLMWSIKYAHKEFRWAYVRGYIIRFPQSKLVIKSIVTVYLPRILEKERYQRPCLMGSQPVCMYGWPNMVY